MGEGRVRGRFGRDCRGLLGVFAASINHLGPMVKEKWTRNRASENESISDARQDQRLDRYEEGTSCNGAIKWL